METKSSIAFISFISLLLIAGSIFYSTDSFKVDETLKQLKERVTDEKIWNQWKQSYGFNFVGQEEEYRRLVFMKNYLNIIEHNIKKEETYTLGMNQFTHLASDEFTQLFLHKLPQHILRKEQPIKPIIIQTSENLQEIDWNKQGKVSPVKSQGTCDAGYAFCTASLFESYYLFKDSTISLSEQQIIDCSADYTTFGCKGGSRSGTIQYITKKGLTAEKNYPFKGVKGECQKTSGENKPTFKLIEANGCDDLKNKLQKTPLTIAINAKTIQSYRSGIYNGCTSTEVNHDIYLIGATEAYWRLKNSWGVRWGQFGYIRLKAGNTCGICEKPGYGFQVI